MGTADFNILDKLIAYLRKSKIEPEICKNDIVLDFGCGYQNSLLNSIKDKIKKGIGVDYDAVNSIDGNIEIMKFNFSNRMPFEQNYFNVITLLAVLEHIDLYKIEILFKEFKRILKKDGKILITVPTPTGKPIMEFLAFKLRIISSKEIGDHKKYYDLDDIKEIAEKYHFKLEKYKRFEFGINSFIVLRNN